MTNTTAPDLTALADAIRERFMPLVFTCDCAGSHPSCREALDSPVIWAQHDTVLRIANFINSYNH
jgi:hypothetical protein